MKSTVLMCNAGGSPYCYDDEVISALENEIEICRMNVFKDRQQEAQPVLLALRYYGDFYIPLGVQNMYYIQFISLLYGLSINIKHVQIKRTDTIWA